MTSVQTGATVVCNVTERKARCRHFSTGPQPFGEAASTSSWATTGASWGHGHRADMTDDQWGKVIDITLTGVFRCMRAASRHMVRRDTRGVVNNASVIGWRAQEGQAHYAAAKAGVMALTRCAAIDVATQHRVNAVSPSLAMHSVHRERVTSNELLAELKAA